jgi:hypothetical protein
MKDPENAKFKAIELAVEAGADIAYWHSRTPQERMWAVELMRQRAYGYDDQSVPEFQRVIEFVDLRQNPQPGQAQDSENLPEE